MIEESVAHKPWPVPQVLLLQSNGPSRPCPPVALAHGSITSFEDPTGRDCNGDLDCVYCPCITDMPIVQPLHCKNIPRTFV